MSDFSNLLIPIHGVSTKDIVKNHRQLERHQEFTSYPLDKDRDRIIRYINYLYSVKSPLITMYRNDLMTRKEEAAILAGYDIKKEKDWIEENLYLLKNQDIVIMVVRFLIMQNNMVWINIGSHEQIYFQNLFYIYKFNEEDTKDKNKDVIEAQKKKNTLATENLAVTKTLDGLYEQLFANAEDVHYVYKKSEDVRLNFTSPESVAKMPKFERTKPK